MAKPKTSANKPRGAKSKDKPAVRTRTGVKKKADIPEEISWRVWLAGQRPWLSVFALLVIVGTILFFAFDVHPVAGILAFLVLFAFLNPYFIPIRFQLTQKEVIIGKFYYTDRREWSMFRRYFLTRSGAVLSTFAQRKKFLDNFRGVQLYFPPDEEKKKRILDFLSSKLPLDSGQSLK